MVAIDENAKRFLEGNAIRSDQKNEFGGKAMKLLMLAMEYPETSQYQYIKSLAEVLAKDDVEGKGSPTLSTSAKDVWKIQVRSR